jgi:hypothetical protein
MAIPYTIGVGYLFEQASGLQVEGASGPGFYSVVARAFFCFGKFEIVWSRSGGGKLGFFLNKK